MARRGQPRLPHPDGGGRRVGAGAGQSAQPSTSPSSTGTWGPATTVCAARGPDAVQPRCGGHHGYRLRPPGDAARTPCAWACAIISTRTRISTAPRSSRRCGGSSIASVRPGAPSGCIRGCSPFARRWRRCCRWCRRRRRCTIPVPLPAAVGNLFRFLMRTTGASDGVLLVRGYDAERQPAEICRVYDTNGQRLEGPLVPFARSLAGSAASMQKPSADGTPGSGSSAGNLELQPFERGRRSLLAAPLSVAPGLQAVLELFDKNGPRDRFHAKPTANSPPPPPTSAPRCCGRRWPSGRCSASCSTPSRPPWAPAIRWPSRWTGPRRDPRIRRRPPCLQRLREGLADGGTLALRCGGCRGHAAPGRGDPRPGRPARSAAVHHCIRLVESLRQLLDEDDRGDAARERAAGRQRIRRRLRRRLRSADAASGCCTIRAPPARGLRVPPRQRRRARTAGREIPPRRARPSTPSRAASSPPTGPSRCPTRAIKARRTAPRWPTSS